MKYVKLFHQYVMMFLAKFAIGKRIPWVMPLYETVNGITFTTVVDDDVANRKGYWKIPLMAVVKNSNTHATIYTNSAMRNAPPKVFSVLRQLAIECAAERGEYTTASTYILSVVVRRMKTKVCNSDQLIEVTQWLHDNTWLVSLQIEYHDLIRRIKMWQI